MSLSMAKNIFSTQEKIGKQGLALCVSTSSQQKCGPLYEILNKWCKLQKLRQNIFRVRDVK